MAKVISDFSPDIVAISVLFSNLLESAHNIAKIVKKVKKNTTVVLGSNHISNMVTDYNISLVDKNSNLPDRITHFDDKNFDFAITGEAEFAFVRFVNAIVNNEETKLLLTFA